MKSLSWHALMDVALMHYKKFGVYIAGDQFDFEPEYDQRWDEFIARVKEVFPEPDALNIFSSVLNNDLIMFDTEEEAWRLYRIMESPYFADHEYAWFGGPDGSITENT